jgi:hypothetical protein
MSHPTRDPRNHKTNTDDLQSQRQRLHQAWVAGASIEETAALMHSVFELLASQAAAKGKPRPGGSLDKRTCDKTIR